MIDIVITENGENVGDMYVAMDDLDRGDNLIHIGRPLDYINKQFYSGTYRKTITITYPWMKQRHI